LFHQEHEKAYGYAHAGRTMEIANLRSRLVIRMPKPRLRPSARKARRLTQASLLKTKAVWFGGKPLQTPIYVREYLEPGARLRGPLVIVEYSSTTVVPPDFECYVDEYLNLILSTAEDEK
jgi:N-methylhydantoinase A